MRKLELAGPDCEDQTFELYGWVEEETLRIAIDGTPHLQQNSPRGLIEWRRGNLNKNRDAYDYQPVSKDS